MEKSYEKVVDFVQEQILDGVYSTGDKLPSERDGFTIEREPDFCSGRHPYTGADGGAVLPAGFGKLHHR